jgi:hypothetical protein
MTEVPDPRFVRPTWTPRVFRDANGNVIEYGNRRWRGDSPPEWAYNVTSNLERFAPLHLVAEALVEHLMAVYQVDVSEARDQAAALEPEPPEFVRLVRLAPTGTNGGPMTIVFTSFPGVVIYPASRFPEGFPACGCDACDDAVDDVADSLEERVLTLASELGWLRRK